MEMAPARRSEVVAAAWFSVAMFVAIAIAQAFVTVDQVALWSPAVVVVVAYLATGRLAVRVPVAIIGRVLATMLVRGFDVAELGFVAVSAVLFTSGYALGIWFWSRTRGAAHEHVMSDVRGAVTAVAFLVLTPFAVASAVAGLVALSGPDPDVDLWRAALTFALGDAAPLVGVLPLFAVLRNRTGGWRRGVSPPLAITSVVASAAAAWFGSTVVIAGDRRMLLVAGLPLVATAWRCRAVVAAASTAVTGVALAVGLMAADVPSGTALLAQGAFVLVGGTVTVVAVISTVARASEPRETKEVIAGFLTAGLDDYRATMAVTIRRIRLVAIAVIGVSVAAGLTVPNPGNDVPEWVGSGLLVGALAISNVMSKLWDTSEGFGLRRQRREAAVDAAVMIFGLSGAVTQTTVLAPPLALALFGGLLAVRLPRREAALVALLTPALHLGLRAAGLVIDPTIPPPAVMDAVVTMLVPTVIALIVGSAIERLEGLRGEMASVTEQVATMHRALATANDELVATSVRERASSRQLRATVARLQRTNLELEQVRGQLEGFGSVVAHDLRGPISTAAALADAAVDARLPPETTAAFMRRIGPNLDRANLLLTRLYDHARTSTIQLAVVGTDLNTVVSGVLDGLSLAVQEAEATVVQRRLLPQVACDPVLIGQVLSNLVGNALRYGGLGVRVEIDASWGDDGVTVTVEDDGPGFGAEDPALLFVAGRQGRATAEDGLGLGLATARTVLERHGGQIKAHESSLGGAAVSFTLPDLREGGSEVLVVEDDPDIRQLYTTMLRQTDPSVTVYDAGSVEEAQRLMAAHPQIALALIDQRLPDGLGTDLLGGLAVLGVPTHIISAYPADVGQLDPQLAVLVSDKRELMDRIGGGIDHMVGAALGVGPSAVGQA